MLHIKLNKLKKIFSSVMLMVFMLNILPSIHVFADGYQGFCGEKVAYSFSKDTEELVIFGAGDMFNYDNADNPAYKKGDNKKWCDFHWI